MTASLAQEGPKDKLDMSSRQPVGARDGFKTATLCQEGAKDRLEMFPRQPSWAKKVPRIDWHGFKTASLGQR